MVRAMKKVVLVITSIKVAGAMEETVVVRSMASSETTHKLSYCTGSCYFVLVFGSCMAHEARAGTRTLL